MMVISLIVISRERLFSAQRERDSVSALYLAEAGVADSLVALEGDVNWAGTSKVQMQDGYYSVTWSSQEVRLKIIPLAPAAPEGYRPLPCFPWGPTAAVGEPWVEGSGPAFSP